MARRTGEFVERDVFGYSCRIFIPHPLPPNPPLAISSTLQQLLDYAHVSLGRLDALCKFVPDPDLFLYSYVRQEAVLSSQIEGTRSTLSDLLRYENEGLPGVPASDVVEVSNYVRAMQFGASKIRSHPILDGATIRELHGILLGSEQSNKKEAGKYRTEQTWVDGARPDVAAYLPPPQSEVPKAMLALEQFLSERSMPPLLKTALAHVQFESIHPFKDGNGRTGRLLIPLILCAEKMISEPLLYLSLYFKRHREEYTECLQRVRFEGDWEGWIEFFARGVQETADSAVDMTRRIQHLFSTDTERIRESNLALGSGLRIFKVMCEKCIASVQQIAILSNVSVPTANSMVSRLESIGILREITGKKAKRLYAYSAYIELLMEGTED
jgi:Fic family protein